MKKIMAGLTAIAVALMLSACTTVTPMCATSNAVGKKVGESSFTMILGIPLPLFTQDIGIQAAAKNGNITKISTVDSKFYTILGFYSKVSTVVTGE